jgi:hypothetical protein
MRAVQAMDGDAKRISGVLIEAAQIDGGINLGFSREKGH